MYSLYVNTKNTHELKIGKARQCFLADGTLEKIVREKPYKFNDNYYFSTKRKRLLELALFIKETWITRLENEIKEIKKIEIK